MLYGIIIQMISYIFCLLASTCPISHLILIICFLLNVKLGGAVIDCNECCIYLVQILAIY